MFLSFVTLLKPENAFVGEAKWDSYPRFIVEETEAQRSKATGSRSQGLLWQSQDQNQVGRLPGCSEGGEERDIHAI